MDKLNGINPEWSEARQLLATIKSWVLTAFRLRSFGNDHRRCKLRFRGDLVVKKSFLLGVQDINFKLFSLSFSLLHRRSTKLRRFAVSVFWKRCCVPQLIVFCLFAAFFRAAAATCLPIELVWGQKLVAGGGSKHQWKALFLGFRLVHLPFAGADGNVFDFVGFDGNTIEPSKSTQL